MKILYDHQIFSIQKYGGISRYFTQIISNFPQHIQTEIAIKYSNNEYLKEFNSDILDFPFEKFLPGISFRGKHRLFNYIEKIRNNPPPEIVNKNLSIELLKKQDFDIFHPTYYDDYFLEYIGNKPFVLTIHDMIHELFPEMIKEQGILIKKARLAEKAAHIIAVSEKTKQDIINIYNINADKISVIYHASSINKKINKAEEKLPQNYLLYVGARSHYKNFMFFALSIKKLLIKRKNLKIVCTGTSFSDEEINFLKEIGIEDYFTHLFIKDDEFFQVYKNAQALIFPSYYEGFGIPILEAFDSDCPVILSNSSCFEEIAGDAAIYFEPKNKTQLIESIEEIMDNPEIRAGLILKGKARLQKFSWSLAAKKTTEVYSNILSNISIE